ncbi:hypothetical protein [Mammaliicoccus sciuri]|uniref:hypothetical protein n=1 Tax=Mammaliicoccus sciuri TaxID=1296 RepID=UPI0016233F84|nr:hypothetical protein [Mammaliicoccus sciuri]
MSIRELLLIAKSVKSFQLEEVNNEELEELHQLEKEKYIKLVQITKDSNETYTIKFEEDQNFKHIIFGIPASEFTDEELEELENLRNDDRYDISELFEELNRLKEKYPEADIEYNIHTVEDTDEIIEKRKEIKELGYNYHNMNELEKARYLNKTNQLTYEILLGQPIVMKLKDLENN